MNDIATPRELDEENYEVGELLKVEDYVAFAMRRNPGLKASLSAWRAAWARIPQEAGLDDPRISLGYFVDEVETRVGPQRRRFGVQQTIPWVGKRSLKRERAEELAYAAEAKYFAERLRIKHEVETVFYEYYYCLRSVSLTEENILLLKGLEQVAQAGVRAGRPMSAVLQAQIEIGALEEELSSLRGSQAPLVARLQGLLDLPLYTKFPNPGIINSPLPSQIILEPSEEMLRKNPELEALGHLSLGAAANEALAKKMVYPDLTLGLDYIETGAARARGTPDSSQDSLIASVSFTLPIWREKNRARVEEAKRELEASENILENRGNTLAAELKFATFKYEDSHRKIRLYNDTLMPLALNALNVARESYEAGRVGFLEIIGAQRLLLEFQRAKERAFVDRQLAWSEIETLSGVDTNFLMNEKGAK